MSCQICLEKYNHSEFKPYTLYSCSHTICYQCLNSLTEPKCPKCRCVIKDKKPNFGLLELIPDVNAKIEHYLNELATFKKEFKHLYDTKQSQTKLKLNKLKTQLNEHTDKLINEILSEQKTLLDEIDKLDACLSVELNDLMLNEQQFEINFKLALTNLRKNQFNEEASREVELKREQFKHKMKMFDSIEFEFEFQMNKFVDAQLKCGIIGTINKKQVKKTFFFCLFF